MPLGTTVDELCGQPEQKYGIRVAMSVVSASTRCASFRRATCAGELLVRACAPAAARRCRSRCRWDRARPSAGTASCRARRFLPMQVGWLSGAVKLFAHLHLDQRALLLDHDDQLEPLRELGQLALGERIGTGDLVDAKPEVVGAHLVDAELVERLPHVEIGLAERDDADLRIAPARGDDLVELVGAHERDHGVALVVGEARLHAEDGVAEADVEPALRHREVVGDDDLHAVEAAVDHRRGLDRLVHAFERGPGAGVARHRPAVEAVVDDLLDARRIEDRDHQVDEMEFRLMRGGGRLRGVVVAHQRQHAAVLRGAGEIGVAEHVAAAVDAGALAVPHAEHAVVFALAAQFRLLRAPHRGGGELLVDAGLEDDVGLLRATCWRAGTAGRGRRAASRDSR